MKLIFCLLILIVNSDLFVDLTTVKLNHILTKTTGGLDYLCFDNGIANIGNMRFSLKTNTSLDAYQTVNIGGVLQDVTVGKFEYNPQNYSSFFF